MSNKLTWKVDSEEMKSILRSEFMRDPRLLDEVHQLIVDGFFREEGSLFDYLFIAAPKQALGTDYAVLGFRLRDPDERRAASGT